VHRLIHKGSCWIHLEAAHVKLQDEIRRKIGQNSKSSYWQEYHDPKRKEAVFPFFILRILTVFLHGNPFVIGCYSNWWEKVEDAVLCEVTLFFLIHYGTRSDSLFGGVRSLGINYWFYKKNLSWKLIHQKYRIVDDMLDIQIPPSSKSLNPDATHNAVLAEPTTTLDSKTYRIALSMIKTFILK
jgi:hypothetical protein